MLHRYPLAVQLKVNTTVFLNSPHVLNDTCRQTQIQSQTLLVSLQPCDRRSCFET